MTNEQKILRYLKSVKSASKRKIDKATGLYEVGEYISRLRRKGHFIRMIRHDYIDQDGRKRWYGVYWYAGMKK